MNSQISVEFISDGEYELLLGGRYRTIFYETNPVIGTKVIEINGSEAVVEYMFEKDEKDHIVRLRLEVFDSSEFLKNPLNEKLDLSSKYIPSDEIAKCLVQLRAKKCQVTAKNAFFENETDFSEVKFGDGTSFSRTVFGNKTVFSGAVFGDETNFSRAVFGDETNFSGGRFKTFAKLDHRAVFGNKTVFSGAVFGNMTNFSCVEFGDGTDISSVKFGDGTDISDARFGDGTSFSRSVFSGKTIFSRAVFGDGTDISDARFSSKMDLHKIELSYRTDFSSVKFGEGTRFMNTKFGNGADFSKAVFGDRTDFSFLSGDRTDFSSVKFGNKTVFFSARFGDRTSFTSARFGDGTSFTSAEFGNGKDFSSTVFGDGTSFFTAKFGDGTSFTGAKFGDDAMFLQTEFKGRMVFSLGTPVAEDSEPDLEAAEPVFDSCLLDFSYSQFYGKAEIDAIGKILIMRETSIKDVLKINDFKKIDLSGAVILERLAIRWKKMYAERGFLGKRESPNLIDITGYSLKKKENKEAYEKMPEKHRKKINDILNRYYKKGYDTAETEMETLQALKENYHMTGEYDSEASAFVEYMRAKATKSEKFGSGGRERIGRKLERWGFNALDFIGEYGTNVLRIFFFLIAVPLLMSFPIFLASLTADSFSLSMVWGSLQISYEAFLTLGIRTADTDNGLLRIVCYICGYMGLFLMAYFVVAVARRTLR